MREGRVGEGKGSGGKVMGNGRWWSRGVVVEESWWGKGGDGEALNWSCDLRANEKLWRKRIGYTGSVNNLKLSRKEKNFMCKLHQCFSKLRCFFTAF